MKGVTLYVGRVCNLEEQQLLYVIIKAIRAMERAGIPFLVRMAFCVSIPHINTFQAGC